MEKSERSAAAALREADIELSNHFTAAIGVRAQSYERFGGSFDPRRSDDGLVAQLGRHDVKLFDAVAATFARVEAAHRRVLELVYAIGAGALHEDAVKDGLLVVGIVADEKGERDPLGLLKVRLRPSWGFGTFMHLATRQKRVLTAFRKRYPDHSPDAGAVVDFLAAEAGHGYEKDNFFNALCRDCEDLRTPALAAYDRLRVDRVKVAKAARDEEKQRRDRQLDARNARFREQLRAEREVRAAARFDQRLRGVG